MEAVELEVEAQILAGSGTNADNVETDDNIGEETPLG